ncbi:unnamed protein product [Caenorhabditis bovis]|uniref:ADP-ribosylation factor 1-like 2 n=1 Tax=Caenorhabditis bovis TaxID=2654633 RepID=A0A8S1F9B7_9PELO|nr:unnamed protein product [Caenorhabditis bovis]
MLGLDNAGKTTLLFKLKLKEDPNSKIDFGQENLTFENMNINVLDLGGTRRDHYYAYFNPFKRRICDALIFVVCSWEEVRFNEARQALHCALHDFELTEVPILVFANKQDLPGSKSAEQIAKALDLTSIKSHRWFIVGTNAITSEGVYEGLTWLKETLTQ